MADPTPAEMRGRIVHLALEDGKNTPYLCGLEDCECPDHDEQPREAGTYVTVRLDEPAGVGFWAVKLVRVDQEDSRAPRQRGAVDPDAGILERGDLLEEIAAPAVP